MADPGGATSMHPPMGPNSFIFAYVSAKTRLCRRSAPLNGSAPPQREILDPQLLIDGRMESIGLIDYRTISRLLVNFIQPTTSRQIVRALQKAHARARLVMSIIDACARLINCTC